MKCKSDLCPQEHHSIEILNFQDGEEVCYSVIAIEGIVKADCGCFSERCVTVERIDGPWCSPPISSHYITENRKFKCIIKLEPGANSLIFKHCSVKQEFILHFSPRPTQFCVLPVYVICKDHDGRFQAPEDEDNSIESACDRIATGMKLVQSLVAEQLNKIGCGKRTFQLQSDTDCSAPDCHVFYSNIPVAKAHAADGDTLWTWIGRELMSSHLGSDNHKFVAFLSSTYYKRKISSSAVPTQADIVECTRGHVALGGGGLALVHTGCLHTWATSIEEVVPRFSSITRVDTKLFMDVSDNRGTYGGCFSTSLGIVAHEIGHTFDLGHTTHGIMGTEYHNIHYMFLPEEAQFLDTALLPSACFQEKAETLPRDQDSAGTKATVKQAHQLIPQITQKTKQMPIKLSQELRVVWHSPELQEKESASDSGGLVPSNKATLKVLDLHCKNDSTNSQPTYFRPINKSCTSENIRKPETDLSKLDYFRPTLDTQDVSIFFTESSLALLAFNRWTNPLATEDLQPSITYDKLRRKVKSENGLRVVDVRDATSKSLLHWKFLQNMGLSEFTIPQEYILSEACSLCIIDSVGNVLKPNLYE